MLLLLEARDGGRRRRRERGLLLLPLLLGCRDGRRAPPSCSCVPRARGLLEPRRRRGGGRVACRGGRRLREREKFFFEREKGEVRASKKTTVLHSKEEFYRSVFLTSFPFIFRSHHSDSRSSVVNGLRLRV